MMAQVLHRAKPRSKTRATVSRQVGHWQSQRTARANYNKGGHMAKAKMSKHTIGEEAMNQEPKNEEIRSHEIKLQETKRPANLRANPIPVDGFVLSVDGKLKARYETSKDAMTAASKLKQSYPVIQVAVYDAAERIYTPVELHEQEN
jgi:hypothetical protein